MATDSASATQASSISGYWAEDHDAQTWAVDFKRLASAAHERGRKKDKKALAKYRSMRLAIGAQTQRMRLYDGVDAGSLAPNQAPLDSASVSIVGCRGGGAHADPLAVASRLVYPLLVPLRHCGLSADGDLESECRRRCCGDFSVKEVGGRGGKAVATNGRALVSDVDVGVSRGLEDSGYQVYPPEQVWALRLIGYEHLRTEQRLPSFHVPRGRDDLENRLYQSLISANARRNVGNGVVLTGIPFCRGSVDDDALIAAELTVRALKRVGGVSILVLAGRNARDSLKVFKEASAASQLERARIGNDGDAVHVHMWRGQDPPWSDADQVIV